MRVLGLVVARGGSKGLPGKNVRDLGGHPLVGYAAAVGAACEAIDVVAVSTDDAEIAGTAEAYGAAVVIDRPGELASDTAPVLGVVKHALVTLEAAGERFDAVCLLQPTCPLRRVEDVHTTIALLAADESATSACTLAAVVDAHPARLRRVTADGEAVQFLEDGGDREGEQRQDHEPAYRRNGAAYVTRVETIENSGSLYGSKVKAFVMPELRSINIDGELDLLLAESVLRLPAFANDAAAIRRMMGEPRPHWGESDE